ncbi:SusC/RagA family TonB-linked outer membrane protein [Plebeiibacterium marinum]|uniref:SusC/RagA family TonB-linked outer membrane protein n=1 Tax=Plebeiibacterium marinum TaxID=2992111 RepID=A0AAE3ME68_9BACT|nr:SusC/RagA family TonB-linked outer membrane protein [Plebeiobacterium marinum]MCW3805397.1 SusC/RagA family TonB-linked outer membrane protein [Plebeiobacterium marinum]
MRKLALFLSMILFVGLQTMTAQTKAISGKVFDSQGEVIPGVSIIVKGTTVGTITRPDGTYSLNVPGDAKILVFSFVGMKTQDVLIEGRSTINVTMESDAIDVDEVVVTALGIRKEAKALGYATSNVGADELTQSGEQNVIQALAGKASGIQVIGSGGTPGASSKILIRGNSSFTGNNEPLIVVDGVPIDNTTSQTNAGDNPYNKNLEGVNNSNRALDINPDDIESVTVLKGPAAAALYGVRAANGAILYTTKKGTQGAASFTYEYKLDISEVSQLPDFQDEYTQGSGGDYNMDGYASWGAKMSDEGLTPIHNVDNFFDTGVTHTHNFSVRGGNEKSNFRLSLSHMEQDGMIPNTDLTRTSVRMSGETEVYKDFKVGGTANYVKSGGNKGQNGSNLAGLMLSLFRAPVSFNLYDKANGGYYYPDGEQRKYIAYFDNPYWSVYNNTFEDEIDRVMGNFYANYKYKWLTFDYKLGVDYYADSRKAIIAVDSYGGDAGDGTGEVVENIIRNRELYSNFMISASHSFMDGLNGSLSVGHNLNEQFNQSLYARGRNLTAPDFYHLSNASDLYADEAKEIIRTSAVFFIADVDYNNLIYLNVTGRNEWASTLGSKQMDFFYPSVSTSFVFSELLPENPILTFGKLRLGWAKAGNNPDAYATSSYYTQPIVAAGMTGGIGYPYLGESGFSNSTTLGNPDLKPEMTTGIEAGLDIRLLNGRANIDLTYYKQETKDILVARPIAPTTGFSELWQNSGEMENRGIELSVGGTPVKLRDFSWDINLNFTKNENEVKKLAEGVDEIEIEAAFYSMGSYAIVGDPYGALYSDMWVRDANGKMVVDDEGYPIIADERGNVGNPFPDWLMNIRNTFSYKSLSLSFLLDIRQGGDIWGGTIARLNQIGRTAITADREGTIVVDGVTESGAQNTVAISKEDYLRYVIGDWGPGENAVYDGSWVRLRDVTLSYKLKFKGSSPVSNYIKAMTFTASGRNLWLSTDYPGVDPETSLTGAGSNLTGFDYFNMPGSKSYVFGVKVDF